MRQVEGFDAVAIRVLIMFFLYYFNIASFLNDLHHLCKRVKSNHARV